MALTAAEITQVYQIFELPQQGTGTGVSQIGGFFGPASDTYDWTALNTNLDAILAALTTSLLAHVRVLLARWDVLGYSQPIQIFKTSTGAIGTFADHPRERQSIRFLLGTAVGFAVPVGGFIGEQRASASRRIER